MDGRKKETINLLLYDFDSLSRHVRIFHLFTFFIVDLCLMPSIEMSLLMRRVWEVENRSCTCFQVSAVPQNLSTSSICCFETIDVRGTREDLRLFLSAIFPIETTTKNRHYFAKTKEKQPLLLDPLD